MSETSPEPSDDQLIREVLSGREDRFELLIKRYQPRVFATARRYARRQDEVEDVVQEIFVKAFQKLASFRGEAPFEHWLMRMAVRVCYDFLRQHQRNREISATELSREEADWIEQVADAKEVNYHSDAAKQLVHKLLEQLSPPARLIINLLELEEKSIKEISLITGWSVPLVKVRAFRARAEMRKCLARLVKEQYM
jgi:RNA polymerase sigma-70 factor (ECF subfamily)